MTEDQLKKEIVEIEDRVRDLDAQIKKLKKEKNHLTALIPAYENQLRAMQPPNPKGMTTIGI